MTREEAEEYAKEMTYRDAVYNALQGKCIPYRKATFIKLYELLDKLEQEPCEDAISRLDMLDAVGHGATYTSEDLQKIIKALPPVNPQPKIGHWISDAIQGEIDGQIVKGFICSECGAISVFRMTGGEIVNGDLCPNCGAKMIKPQESEG